MSLSRSLSFASLLLCAGLVGCDSTESSGLVDPGAGGENTLIQPVATPTEFEVPSTAFNLSAAAGSQVAAVGRKITGSHDVAFPISSGTVEFNEGQAQSIRFELDMANLTSDSERLTGHLKNEDFFAVEQYPTATFASTSVQSTDGVRYIVEGDLTMHGQTHNVRFTPTINFSSASNARVNAEFTIDRQQWGISYPGRPDDLIADQVAITLDFELNAG